MNMSATEIWTVEMSGMPGSTDNEWHLDRTVDDIARGHTEYNGVFHLLNELANPTTRAVALTRIAASEV